MPLDPSIQIRRVWPKQIRKIFNDGQFWQRMKNGELREIVMESHPASSKSGQPRGTKSQICSYRDQYGHEVARVHQFKRKDGTLGASGKPDPKKLLHKGVLYLVNH
jgi:hypothetical protein